MSRYYKNEEEVSGLREARKVGAVPSVTTVINATTPHAYQYMNDKRLRDALNEGESVDEMLEMLGNSPVFEQGNIVHEAAEMFLQIGVTSTLLDCPASSKSFYSYLSKIKPFVIEKFYSWKKGNTGGRVDLIGERDGKMILVDYKTVASVKKKMQKSWVLQLGAYYEGAMENGIQIQGAEIVQFSKKNKGVVVLQAGEEELKEGGRMFLLARELYRFYHGI